MVEPNYTQRGIVEPDDTLQPPEATHRSVDDIVTRLREEVMWVRHKTKNQIVPDPLCQEAADEIERLREQLQDARMYLEQDACEIERLRAETKRTLRQKLRETARERDEWRERYLNATLIEDARRG